MPEISQKVGLEPERAIGNLPREVLVEFGALHDDAQEERWPLD